MIPGCGFVKINRRTRAQPIQAASELVVRTVIPVNKGLPVLEIACLYYALSPTSGSTDSTVSNILYIILESYAQ